MFNIVAFCCCCLYICVLVNVQDLDRNSDVDMDNINPMENLKDLTDNIADGFGEIKEDTRDILGDREEQDTIEKISKSFLGESFDFLKEAENEMPSIDSFGAEFDKIEVPDIPSFDIKDTIDKFSNEIGSSFGDLEVPDLSIDTPSFDIRGALGDNDASLPKLDLEFSKPDIKDRVDDMAERVSKKLSNFDFMDGIRRIGDSVMNLDVDFPKLNIRDTLESTADQISDDLSNTENEDRILSSDVDSQEMNDATENTFETVKESARDFSLEPEFSFGSDVISDSLSRIGDHISDFSSVSFADRPSPDFSTPEFSLDSSMFSNSDSTQFSDMSFDNYGNGEW